MFKFILYTIIVALTRSFNVRGSSLEDVVNRGSSVELARGAIELERGAVKLVLGKYKASVK